MDRIDQYFETLFDVQEIKLNGYSPLALAYVGDSVYDLIIRTLIVYEGNMQVNKMNNRAKTFVKASAQVEMFHAIEDKLTEEELDAFKRGRNAKTNTRAKNATLNDYRIATGYETMLGYIYLKKDYKRLLELVHEGVNACQNKQKNS